MILLEVDTVFTVVQGTYLGILSVSNFLSVTEGDTTRSLLDEKSNSFLTGLLDSVVEFLALTHIEYEINDLRPALPELNLSVDPNCLDGIEQESFDFKVKPYKDAIIEEEALKVSGVTKKQIRAYPPMNKVYLKIIAVLEKQVDRYNKQDKLHLCGYNNASFDNQFFRAFFAQNNDPYFGSWFWSDSIDVMVLAANKLRAVRHDMKDFKLRTVAEYLNIKIDETKLHDALYDIRIT